MQVAAPYIRVVDLKKPRKWQLFCQFGYRYFEFHWMTYWAGVVVSWNAPMWDRNAIKTGIEVSWNSCRHEIRESEPIHHHSWRKLRIMSLFDLVTRQQWLS